MADSPEHALAGQALTVSLPSGITSTTLRLGSAAPLPETAQVNSTAHTLTFGFDLGLDPGTAVVYSGTNGAPIVGLTVGQTYYAIADPANPSVLRLADTADHALTGVALAISSSASSVGVILESVNAVDTPFADTRPSIVIHLGLSSTVLSGTAHTFTPTGGSGISVTAKLSSVQSASTNAGLGDNAPTARSSKFAGAYNFALKLKGGLNAPPVPQSNNPAATLSPSSVVQGAPAANGTAPSFALAGSFVVQLAQDNVQAIVGSHAVLEAGQDVQVHADLSEKVVALTQASISVPQGTQQSNAALAVTYAVITPTVKALVGDGVQVDGAAP